MSVLHRRTEIRSFLLLLTYGVSLAVPFVHNAYGVRPRYDLCQVSQHRGPVLRADCQGPCNDPTHHHHRGRHDCEHCIVCRCHAASQWTNVSSEIGLGFTGHVTRVHVHRIVVSSTDRHRSDVPRGPPSPLCTA